METQMKPEEIENKGEIFGAWIGGSGLTKEQWMAVYLGYVLRGSVTWEPVWDDGDVAPGKADFHGELSTRDSWATYIRLKNAPQGEVWWIINNHAAPPYRNNIGGCVTLTSIHVPMKDGTPSPNLWEMVEKGTLERWYQVNHYWISPLEQAQLYVKKTDG